MDKHIETLGMMEAAYVHIRKNDDQYEAIEAAISALQEQAEREEGCKVCNKGVDIIYSPADDLYPYGAEFCPHCGRRLK